MTPGPLAPARELLGFMLLEANRPKDALVAFEAVTKKEPNRFLALYGAGKAAEATKQTSKAKGYYKQIVEICKDAGAERPELQYARKAARRVDRKRRDAAETIARLVTAAQSVSTNTPYALPRKSRRRRHGPRSGGAWPLAASRHRTRRSGTPAR